jgi:hypothetical protein
VERHYPETLYLYDSSTNSLDFLAREADRDVSIPSYYNQDVYYTCKSYREICSVNLNSLAIRQITNFNDSNLFITSLDIVEEKLLIGIEENRTDVARIIVYHLPTQTVRIVKEQFEKRFFWIKWIKSPLLQAPTPGPMPTSANP